MMSLKEYAVHNQACLADYLPWALLAGPGLVEHKDGSLQKTFKFRGPDLDSATPRDLMGVASQLNNALRRFGDGWSIFVEAQRDPASEYAASSWPNRAAQLIDDERRLEFTKPGLFFKNDYFLTMVFKEPDQLKTGGARWFTNSEAKNQPKQDSVETFTKAMHELIGLIKGLFPVFVELDADETLTYLHSTVSTKRHHIKTPDVPMYLDHILTDQSLERAS